MVVDKAIRENSKQRQSRIFLLDTYIFILLDKPMQECI